MMNDKMRFEIEYNRNLRYILSGSTEQILWGAREFSNYTISKRLFFFLREHALEIHKKAPTLYERYFTEKTEGARLLELAEAVEKLRMGDETAAQPYRDLSALATEEKPVLFWLTVFFCWAFLRFYLRETPWNPEEVESGVCRMMGMEDQKEAIFLYTHKIHLAFFDLFLSIVEEMIAEPITITEAFQRLA